MWKSPFSLVSELRTALDSLAPMAVVMVMAMAYTSPTVCKLLNPHNSPAWGIATILQMRKLRFSMRYQSLSTTYTASVLTDL